MARAEVEHGSIAYFPNTAAWEAFAVVPLLFKNPRHWRGHVEWAPVAFGLRNIKGFRYAFGDRVVWKKCSQMTGFAFRGYKGKNAARQLHSKLDLSVCAHRFCPI